MKKYILFFLLLSISFWACTDDHGHVHEDGESADAHTHDGTEEEDLMVEEVHFTQTQIEKIGLVMGVLEHKNLRKVLKVNGKLELPPQNEASVSSLMGGVLDKIYVRQGEYITKGKALARLTHPDIIQLQEDYYTTMVTIDRIEKTLARQQKLAEQNIPAQQQLDDLQAEHKAAQARVKGLTTRMQMLGIKMDPSADSYQESIFLRAPISGYVRQINFNTGAFINPQNAVFDMVDNHHIHIDLMVYEQDIPYLKEGQKISFMLQSNPQDVMEARVFAIGKALEETERAVRVHAEIENEKGNLLPGMYVEARVILDDMPKPCLPEEAVAIDKGLAYIFVKEGEEEGEVHFKKVQVITGATDRGYIEVTPLEDLAEDVAIVHQGAYFLMAQTKKNEGGGGHHH
jgi:cobalt-zinc-cadmium efflux system membrane fusion protein